MKMKPPAKPKAAPTGTDSMEDFGSKKPSPSPSPK
jgi:hypothetical protein